MELLYIILGIIALNIFSIYVIKNKAFTSFVLITSVLALFLLTPGYLVEYGILEENIFDKILDLKNI